MIPPISPGHQPRDMPTVTRETDAMHHVTESWEYFFTVLLEVQLIQAQLAPSIIIFYGRAVGENNQAATSQLQFKFLVQETTAALFSSGRSSFMQMINVSL